MKSIATKAVISLLGAGTIATGVVFATLPESYESYLNKQGRPLLKSASTDWENVKNKYNAEGDGLLIKIGDKDIQKTELQADQLKTWCSQNSKKSFSSTIDEIYQRVSAWCTKPKTIAEYIKNGILSDEEPTTGGGGATANTNKDESKWKIKAEDYKTATEPYLVKEIEGSAEKTIIQASSSNAIETKKLRAWCKHSKTRHFKHEEDQRYLTFKKWCVN